MNTDKIAVADVLEAAAQQVERAWCQGIMLVHVNSQVQAACAYGALHNAVHNATADRVELLVPAVEALAAVLRAEFNDATDCFCTINEINDTTPAHGAMEFIFYVNDCVLEHDNGGDIIAQCMRKAAANVRAQI